MNRLFILLLLLLAWPALAADMEARDGADWVRTSEAPCAYAAVLQHIPPQYRPQFQKAQAQLNGVLYFVCWRTQGNMIHLIYEDGDQGLLPAADFAPVKET